MTSSVLVTVGQSVWSFWLPLLLVGLVVALGLFAAARYWLEDGGRPGGRHRG